MLNGLFDVVTDFETFYDQEYSLRKMENAQYIMDARFEVMGFSLKLPGQKTQWFSGDFDYCKKVLSAVPWHRCRLVAHNARFDGSILEWRFGLKPAAYLCTMVGSRPHFVPKTGSMALDAIGQYLKLKAKGNAVQKMAGKHRTDLSETELSDYGVYCCGDTDICCGIADSLKECLPLPEQELIDLTIKKYLRPRLMLDGKKLVERIHALDAERSALVKHIEATLRVTEKQLRSRDQFADLLKTHGATIPMKQNAKGTMTFAFAKDDLGFQKLLLSPNPIVRELCTAKATLGSTLEQARLSRLLDLHNTMSGMLPVPMVYYGCHPGRFSGDEKINLLNLPRVEYAKDGSLKKGHLRFCVKAPPGYKLVTADYSNIEARLVATLARQAELRDAFRDGKDVYAEFASEIYGFKVTKNTHPLERFVGKGCILGLGYGLGWKKFQLRMASDTDNPVVFSDFEAKRIVTLYRTKYSKIPELWAVLEQLCSKFLIDPKGLYTWRGMTFAHERIILPNGMPIQYPDLAQGPKGLYFRSRKVRVLQDDGPLAWEDGHKIWGGTFLENVCQALARIIAVRDELTLTAMGMPVSLQVHDELVWCIPDQLVEICEKAIASTMVRPVEWMPGLPISVDVKHGPDYGSAK